MAFEDDKTKESPTSQPAPAEDQVEQLRAKGRIIRSQIAEAITAGNIDQANKLHNDLLATRKAIFIRNQVEAPKPDPFEPHEDVHEL